MARIRSIKPEFWVSEQVVNCAVDTRLFFIGLWNFADDGGVIPYSVRGLKMAIFPGDTFDDDAIRRMIDELSANALILVFEESGTKYIHVTGWDKHQRIDRPNLKHPQPPGSASKRQKTQGQTDQNSTTIRRGFDEDSTSDHPRSLKESKGKEGIGEERKRREGSVRETKPKPEKFTIPTLTDISGWVGVYPEGYPLEHEAQQFLTWYEDREWKIDGEPIKSWESVWKSWVSRWKPRKSFLQDSREIGDDMPEVRGA